MSSESSTSCENQLHVVKRMTSQLQSELNRVVTENFALESQIKTLSEVCNVQSSCIHDGIYYDDGSTWQPSRCTTCTCKDQEIYCFKTNMDSECGFQCTEDVCLNGGQCHPFHDTFECVCPSGYTGPLCEQAANQCLAHKYQGSCTYEQAMWYFDPELQTCKSTIEECYDVDILFSSFTHCSATCMRGSCCFRKKFEDGVTESVLCKEETLVNCQSLCSMNSIDVIGFYPGTHCSKNGCIFQNSNFCHTGKTLHWVGSKFSFGCEECECLSDQILCRCEFLTYRHEIRELNYSQRQQYKKALKKLQQSKTNNIWISLRDLYATHIMHSQKTSYYLFWHRLFLRILERHLQEIDCSLSIPYFDFTLDAGNLSQSIVWNYDFFGYSDASFSKCMNDNDYKSKNISLREISCFHRNFHSNITVPNMVEIALALTKNDFMEFSILMQKIASYLYLFVGGDMATSGNFMPTFLLNCFVIEAYVYES